MKKVSINLDMTHTQKGLFFVLLKRAHSGQKSRVHLSSQIFTHDKKGIFFFLQEIFGLP